MGFYSGVSVGTKQKVLPLFLLSDHSFGVLLSKNFVCVSNCSIFQIPGEVS